MRSHGPEPLISLVQSPDLKPSLPLRTWSEEGKDQLLQSMLPTTSQTKDKDETNQQNNT